MIVLRFDPLAPLIRLRVTLQAVASRTAIFVFDPGASITLLRPSLARSVGRVPESSASSTVPILTAGGEAQAQQLPLAAVSLYGERIGPLNVCCAPLPAGLKAHGLLGLDVLRRFNIRLDFESGLLRMQRFTD